MIVKPPGGVVTVIVVCHGRQYGWQV